jgi:hypothetical protein
MAADQQAVLIGQAYGPRHGEKVLTAPVVSHDSEHRQHTGGF